jgi:hypothetical protein
LKVLEGVSQTVSYACKEVKGKERGVVRILIWSVYKMVTAKVAKPNVDEVFGAFLSSTTVLFNSPMLLSQTN